MEATKMAVKIQCEGYNYLVIDVMHDNCYGRKIVKHVLTDNDKWAANIVKAACGWENVDTKGQHDLNWQRNPTIENGLKPYVEVKFVQDTMYQDKYDLRPAFDTSFYVDTDCYYVVTYVEPYDD